MTIKATRPGSGSGHPNTHGGMGGSLMSADKHAYFKELGIDSHDPKYGPFGPYGHPDDDIDDDED